MHDPPNKSVEFEDIAANVDQNPSVDKEALCGNIDDAILRANGHKAELRRQFHWLSALGLGFSITNSWVGYLSVFGQTLLYGGPQLVILGLIAAFMIQFVISIGLAEIGSAFPSSGGQYHFCHILSPEKSKGFAGYVIGWLSVIAWWVTTCSGISLTAVTLNGMIQFFNPGFVTRQWVIYMLYVGSATITIAPVFLASKKLGLVVQAGLFMSIIGMLMTLFVTVGTHEHTQPGAFLMDPGLGDSGWSRGTAWILGICNCMYAFGGTDGALHISEEIPNPGRKVPQVIAMTLIIGLITTLPLFIALLLFATDIEAIANSPLPSMELINQACGIRVATVVMIAWLLVVYVMAIPSQWVTSGRIAWAFARDNGVPYSRYFSHVDKRLEFPVRTTVAAFIFVIIYGLLYFASTTAFNSIITSAVMFLNITYAVPQAILVFRGRKDGLPTRYLNLGLFGYFCNIFSVLWVIVLVIFVCFPPSLPVRTETMNYTSVVCVGLFGIVLLLWFVSGRKNFEGPHIDWDIILATNEDSAPVVVGPKEEVSAKATCGD